MGCTESTEVTTSYVDANGRTVIREEIVYSNNGYNQPMAMGYQNQGMMGNQMMGNPMMGNQMMVNNQVMMNEQRIMNDQMMMNN